MKNVLTEEEDGNMFICDLCGDKCHYDEYGEADICKECLFEWDDSDDGFIDSSAAYNMDAIMGTRFGR